MARMAALTSNGLVLYACSTVFLTGMGLAAKIAGNEGVPLFEMVLIRSLILTAMTCPPLLRGRTNPFKGESGSLMLLRGVLGFLSITLLFWSVKLLPLADAMLLGFLAPLFVAVLAPALLKEWPSRGVWIAIPACVFGVVLVTRPQALFGGSRGSLSGVGVAAGISQALCSATARMTVRAINTKVSAESIVFSTGAISLLGSAVASLLLRSWVTPQRLGTYAVLAATGVLGYASQMTATMALQRTKAASAIAMSYLSVIWGVLIDIVVYKKLPGILTLLGASLICACSLVVSFYERREQMAAKRAGSYASLDKDAALEEDKGVDERQPLFTQFVVEVPADKLRAVGLHDSRKLENDLQIGLPGNLSPLLIKAGDPFNGSIQT